VSDVRNSPLVRAKLEILQVARDSEACDISKVLLEDAPKSLRLLQDVRDGKLDATLGQRIDSAKDLLNREPTAAKVTRVDARVMSTAVTMDQLEEIKKRARERAEAFQREKQQAEETQSKSAEERVA
jgi:hypothetical protein